ADEVVDRNQRGLLLDRERILGAEEILKQVRPHIEAAHSHNDRTGPECVVHDPGLARQSEMLGTARGDLAEHFAEAAVLPVDHHNHAHAAHREHEYSLEHRHPGNAAQSTLADVDGHHA